VSPSALRTARAAAERKQTAWFIRGFFYFELKKRLQPEALCVRMRARCKPSHSWSDAAARGRDGRRRTSRRASERHAHKSQVWTPEPLSSRVSRKLIMSAANAVITAAAAGVVAGAALVLLLRRDQQATEAAARAAAAVAISANQHAEQVHHHPPTGPTYYPGSEGLMPMQVSIGRPAVASQDRGTSDSSSSTTAIGAGDTGNQTRVSDAAFDPIVPSMEDLVRMREEAHAADLMRTPVDVLEDLARGNARFWTGQSRRPELNAMERRAEIWQSYPKVAIIGCSDSRVPPEIIFDQGLGDLFVIRVAGNSYGSGVAGSVHYAVTHLHVKVRFKHHPPPRRPQTTPSQPSLARCPAWRRSSCLALAYQPRGRRNTWRRRRSSPAHGRTRRPVYTRPCEHPPVRTRRW
jgi:hypothetical protein